MCGGKILDYIKVNDIEVNKEVFNPTAQVQNEGEG